MMYMVNDNYGGSHDNTNMMTTIMTMMMINLVAKCYYGDDGRDDVEETVLQLHLSQM